MRHVTASTLALLPMWPTPAAGGCAYGPRFEDTDEKVGTKARAGSAVHWLAEMALRGTHVHVEESFPKFDVTPGMQRFVYQRFAVWLVWWRSQGEPAMAGEVAYEFDTATRRVRQLELAGPREYPYLPGCCYGTSDAVRPGWVRDWKTGNPSFYAPAATNTQMLFLAMCTAKVQGADSMQVSLDFIGEDGVESDVAEHDYFALMAFESWLVRAVRSIDTAPPVRGEWCRDKWCRLRKTAKFAGCPAWAAEAAEEETAA